MALFIGGVFCFIPKYIFAQQKSSYTMEFVRAWTSSTQKNQITTIFKVTPTIDNFKLILSMRVTYSLGQGNKVVNVRNSKEDNIRFNIYGNDVREKNGIIYELIKDHTQWNDSLTIYFIVIDFYDMTKENIDSMSITYGLWESYDPNIRNETKYDFMVEKLDQE